MATTWFAQAGSRNIDDWSAGSSTVWFDAKTGGTAMTGANFLAVLAAGDVLSANGQTNLNIYSTFTCVRLSTVAEVPIQGGTTGNAGGGFTFSGSNAYGTPGATAQAVTATLKTATTTCVVCSHTGTGANKLTINGLLDNYGANPSVYCINSSAATGEILINNPGTNAVVGGHTYSSSRGIYSSGTGAVTIVGHAVADAAPATYIGGLLTITNGNVINNGSIPAVLGGFVFNPGAGNYIQYPQTTGDPLKYAKTIPAAQALVHDSALDGIDQPVAGNVVLPSAAQVKSGTGFGSYNGSTYQYTGTLGTIGAITGTRCIVI